MDPLCALALRAETRAVTLGGGFVHHRDIDTLVLSVVNTCWATPAMLPTLLTLIRDERPPGEWLGPVGHLFAEVPAMAVQR